MHSLPRICLVPAAFLMALSVHAESVYQEPADFVAEAFGDKAPASKALWINDEIRNKANNILMQDLRRLRMRYWQADGRTAWILEDIGKDLPITTGVVVADDQIEHIKVLVFRESRGWEVRYPFFTDQFLGVGLKLNSRLDRSIDNITGATLSVNSLKRQASLALLLTSYVSESEAAEASK